MIVLLSYSMNLFASNSNKIDVNPFTGEVVEQDDSVQISYNDLRIVNSKLIELEYEKEINEKLRQVVRNDSIILDSYSINNTILIEKHKKAVKQRNVCFCVTIATIFLSMFLLVK